MFKLNGEYWVAARAACRLLNGIDVRTLRRNAGRWGIRTCEIPERPGPLYSLRDIEQHARLKARPKARRTAGAV